MRSMILTLTMQHPGKKTLNWNLMGNLMWTMTQMTTSAPLKPKKTTRLRTMKICLKCPSCHQTGRKATIFSQGIEEGNQAITLKKAKKAPLLGRDRPQKKGRNPKTKMRTPEASKATTTVHYKRQLTMRSRISAVEQLAQRGKQSKN